MVIVVDVEDSDAEENCCVMVEHNEEELWLRAKRIAGIAGPADDDRNPAKKNGNRDRRNWNIFGLVLNAITKRVPAPRNAV